MNIHGLWRKRWSLLRWSLFAGTMAATAVGTYVVLPHQPRWLVDVGPQVAFYVGDGQFVTYASPEGKASGPLRLWDAATGTELAQFLANGQPFHTFATADDGCRFVSLSKSDKPEVWRIRGVDLRERREWQAELKVGAFTSATFSPRCDYAAVRMAPPKDSGEFYTIVETASGRIVTHLPGAAELIRFADNGRCVAAGYSGEDGEHEIRVVDTATGKPMVIADSRLVAVSPDAQWLIGNRGEHGIWLWDIRGARWHARLDEPKARAPRPAVNERFYEVDDLLRADMDRLIIEYYVSASSGRRHRARHFGSTMGYISIDSDLEVIAGDSRIFSPDARYLLYTALHESQLQVTLIDVQSGKPLWQRTGRWRPKEPMFTADSRRIVVIQASVQFEVLDAATGETQHMLPAAGLADAAWRISRDSQTLVVDASPTHAEPHWLWAKLQAWLKPKADDAPMVVRAYALDSGAVLGELCTEASDQQWLTEDCQSLLTVDSDSNQHGLIGTQICCWDFPPRKPLHWVVLAPLAVALVLLAIHRGWARVIRRGPKTAAPGAAAGA